MCIRAAQGHLEQPGDQQVCGADGCAAGCADLGVQRITAGEQVNDVKVIQIAHKAGQQIRAGDKQHVRQGDAGVLLECICAVHTGGLIQIAGNVHENTGSHQHDVGNTDPNVDHDEQNTCGSFMIPQRVDVHIQQCLGEPAQLQQELADDAGVVKQLGNIQQRNELGDRDGHDQHSPPEFFEFNTLLVDEDRHEHTQEVVGEGGEERPHQRPGQDLAEGKAQTAGAEVE